MAKAKHKAAGSVPNRPIYSRISYLYQAAAYLSSARQSEGQIPDGTPQSSENETAAGQHAQSSSVNTTKQAMSRRLLTDLRASSLKAQIRLSPAMKHTICKYCDTLLVEGDTSTSFVENQSKGGKKPWADVLLVKCNTCGGLKRFPVQAPRQKRRPIREAESKNKAEYNATAPTQVN
ncbi:hypothetical protein DL770_004340 [Monosporascus sp. CRB-9-2]|nr:hypothetical protein DL770_004340 [Monosporascus sp. CRB-9-2]